MFFRAPKLDRLVTLFALSVYDKNVFGYCHCPTQKSSAIIITKNNQKRDISLGEISTKKKKPKNNIFVLRIKFVLECFVYVYLLRFRDFNHFLIFFFALFQQIEENKIALLSKQEIICTHEYTFKNIYHNK